MVRDVSHQVPARHTMRNNLEGGENNTEEWDDVCMCHVSPQYSHFAEDLWGVLAPENGEMRWR